MGVIDRYRLTEVINVSGTMTAIGASSTAPEVIEAMVDILPRFVRVEELQARASEVIARVVGCEAGCISASAAAGVTVAVAASMAGNDLYRAGRLPDTRGMKNRVVIQRGHMVWFGASVGQLARLAGAELVEIGDATRAGSYQLAGAIDEQTAAALYVASHHTVQYGLIDLSEFCRVAHSRGVPVIVDAASESEMHRFLEAGADIAVFSGHKFLAGPTSGIIAGKQELVQACLLHQLAGIGRPMKAGKESIVGAMAALERWDRLDQAATRERQGEVIAAFVRGLAATAGLELRVEADPTGNPIDRLRVVVEPAAAGLTAFELVSALKRNEPPIIVRDHHSIDEGHLILDPCNVTPQQAEYVAQSIRKILELSERAKEELRQSLPERANAADLQETGLRNWPGTGVATRG